MGRMISLACKISRSAFSDDRVFRVTLADGGEHVGAASVMYFSKSDGTPLGPNDPPADLPINGQVAGRSITEFEDTVRVSLPDGGIVEVKSSQVRREAPRNVLLQS